MITLKEGITKTVAKFDHAIAGVLYYNLYVGDEVYLFSIDMNDKDDVGTATFESEYKGINLMRYIRKALDKEELIQIK
jgi:hypothetical protein